MPAFIPLIITAVGTWFPAYAGYFAAAGIVAPVCGSAYARGKAVRKERQ